MAQQSEPYGRVQAHRFLAGSEQIRHLVTLSEGDRLGELTLGVEVVDLLLKLVVCGGVL